MSETFLIVGGDAAGMSAASKAKRDDPELEVVVFEQGRWVSYGACGLPYYVKDDIRDIEDLVALTPEEFIEERDIDLRLESRVTSIDPEAETVVAERDGTARKQSYDHLLISTGARAVTPPLTGMDLERVFTLHDLEDGKQIKRLLDREDLSRTALVGGGYIGLEMAEALHGRGLDVDLFEAMPHVLGPFGEETARVVEKHLQEQDVTLHLDTAVERLEGSGGRVDAVVTGNGTYEADLVLVGTGIRPNVGLAEEAGVELGPTGAIATDRCGRTSEPDVFAAGDCAEATNAVSGEPDYVPLALTANRYGRAIGQSVANDTLEPVGRIVGTALVKVFELEVARTGLLDEERIRGAGFEPASVSIEAKSRAHYYPGGSTIRVTMTADRDSGRLLGVAMVGEEGVAGRVNSAAVALHNGVDLDALEQYDFAYSPPFSPVWDPILTAAKVLNGKL